MADPAAVRGSASRWRNSASACSIAAWRSPNSGADRGRHTIDVLVDEILAPSAAARPVHRQQ
jgi:hypothetical protein